MVRSQNTEIRERMGLDVGIVETFEGSSCNGTDRCTGSEDG
jgi:hypothetical protein